MIIPTFVKHNASLSVYTCRPGGWYLEIIAHFTCTECWPCLGAPGICPHLLPVDNAGHGKITSGQDRFISGIPSSRGLTVERLLNTCVVGENVGSEKSTQQAVCRLPKSSQPHLSTSCASASPGFLYLAWFACTATIFRRVWCFFSLNNYLQV